MIAAAAFAIDALYLKVSDLLDPGDRRRCRRRAGSIVETLKVALDLGKLAQTWQKSIPELVGLRNELVHFRGEDHESQPHPTGKSHVSRESSFFTVERASWAVDLALEVLTTAYRSPRRRHTALVERSEQAAQVPAWLEDLRHGNRE